MPPGTAAAKHRQAARHRAGRLNDGLTSPHTAQRVAWWHDSLRGIALLNIAFWSLAAIAVIRGRGSAEDVPSWRQLLLCAVYVAGCAYRSFLPVVDIPRVVLVDSWWSSVRVGRSVATVAELCFAAQWALIAHRTAVLNHDPVAEMVSLAVLPLIVLAEGFSWYAVLTTSQRAHAVENSLWGLSAALVIACMLVIGQHRLPSLYPAMVAGGGLYVAFIVVYDVPMYWARWRADQARGHEYASVADGWVDVGKRWRVSYSWEDWKDEILWMSLYFTFGVWSSIWLVYASLALVHGP